MWVLMYCTPPAHSSGLRSLQNAWVIIDICTHTASIKSICRMVSHQSFDERAWSLQQCHENDWIPCYSWLNQFELQNRSVIGWAGLKPAALSWELIASHVTATLINSNSWEVLITWVRCKEVEGWLCIRSKHVMISVKMMLQSNASRRVSSVRHAASTE